MGILDGKTILITGGGNGIGKATALMAGELGANVIVNDLGGSLSGADEGSAGPAEEVAAEIRAKDNEVGKCFRTSPGLQNCVCMISITSDPLCLIFVTTGTRSGHGHTAVPSMSALCLALIC